MKVLKLNKKFLNKISKEILNFSKKNLSKEISSIEKLLIYLKKKKNLKSNVFDALNMLPILGFANYYIYELLLKNTNKQFLNWTYPQIRIDFENRIKFKAPIHADKWILSPKKKGYIFWFPLNETGAKLIFYKNKNFKNIKQHRYWGLHSISEQKGKEILVKYGEGILFRENIFHKSFENSTQLTLQCRYEKFKKIKNFERSVTQKTNSKVLLYWQKKYVKKKNI